MNHVTLAGWMGKKNDIKETANSCVLNFSIGTRHSYKDKEGNWTNKTEYTRCALWGNRCDFVASLPEGTPISVEGRISTRSYEKDGDKRWITDVAVENVEPFGDPKATAANSATEIPF
jgi:single-strand DNA-binding protein